MAREPSLAENFYKEITSLIDPDRFKFISNLAAPGRVVFETEWLDFKRQPQKDEHLRKICSKSASEFANTAGGVMIWGIKAVKDKTTRVDKVQRLTYVTEPERFRTRLAELHKDSTDPPIVGETFRCQRIPRILPKVSSPLLSQKANTNPIEQSGLESSTICEALIVHSSLTRQFCVHFSIRRLARR